MAYNGNEQPFLSSMEALCSAEELAFTSGWARGSRLVRVRNDRLAFDILPDRGMGLGALDYRGIPLAWLSSVGPIAPAYYEPEGMGWLRTFSGGALVTCGLSQVGDPCVDGQESYGLHGRISTIPAQDVGIRRAWEDQNYVLQIVGTMHEARVFGEFLALKRTITTTYEQPAIHIHDEITNHGYARVPLMLLYHMNFGYPLVSPQATLLLPSRHVAPYDANATTRLDQHTIPAPPQPNYPEHVYDHDLHAASDGETSVAIVNEALEDGLGLSISWNRATLPMFFQWNMFASGQYVVGLEPSNCSVDGRSKAREQHRLEYLDPGEQKTVDLHLSIVQGRQQIDELRERIAAISA